ncbi:hypothetical protein H0A36_21535 [Endozoicomonas sp. SM1973]|uniref:Uncharacterized protein n=1 Tax=Spartinivicinus marinus TaxID=2994442 RepID=A0A853I9Z1_9GAMM|nr:hypothetical protein [Spartinivicinus marinus]MCX4027123.1 hypothetical protein [Spartinivicinus marinus]NYZ68602.1 hypothetical protein [Spartinivicinus marinus]
MRQSIYSQNNSGNEDEAAIPQMLLNEYESFLKVRYKEVCAGLKLDFYDWAHFILHETIVLSPFYKFKSDEFKEILILTIKSFATSITSPLQRV